MDVKHRNILTNHKGLLTRNIIWTENFINHLLSNQILTDSTLRGIKTSDSSEVKCDVFLDALPFRGKNAYSKFCDTLQMTGHTFLADFLRDEESTSDNVDINDIFKKIPHFDKTLNDRTKELLEQYITEKVKYEKLKDVWRNEAAEKEKALDAKKEQLEQKYSYDKDSKDKMNEIDHLRNELVTSKNECIAQSVTIGSLNAKIKAMEEKHQNEISIQTKFNMANDHGMDVITKRFSSLEETHNGVFSKLMQAIGVEETTKDERIRSTRGVDEFAYININYDKIMNKIKYLKDVKEQYDRLLEETNWVVAHIGFTPEDSSSPGILKAYKEFIIQNEETLQKLRDKVDRCGDLLNEQQNQIDDLSGQDGNNRRLAVGASVWQSAIMNVMRSQLTELKSRYNLRESELSIVKSELSKAKALIKQLEKKDNQETKLFDLEKSRTVSETRSPVRLVHHHATKLVDNSARMQTDSKTAALPPISYRSESPVNKKERTRQSYPKQTASSTPKAKEPPNCTTLSFKFNDRQQNIGSGLGDLRALHNRQKFQQAVIRR